MMKRIARAAEFQLASSLRWLTGAHHLCQQENFSLSKSEFYDAVWDVMWALDKVIPAPKFDIRNERQMRELADKTSLKSGCKMPGSVGALDGMVVRITRPTTKDIAYSTNLLIPERILHHEVVSHCGLL
jgi:hypothetical protein